MHKYLIWVFLFLYVHLSAQKDYRVLSSTSSSLIVEYNPIFTDTSEVRINGIDYQKVEIFLGFTTSEQIGIPDIQSRLLNIGVPSEFGNTIKVLSSNYDLIEGKIIPTPGMKKVDKLNTTFFEEAEDYRQYKNVELVSFGEYGLVRDMRVQSIKINPVQYDPVTQEIKLYNRIVFQVNFSASKNLEKVRKSDLVEDLVINEKIAKNWGDEVSLTKSNNQVNAVLAEGDWYRFEAPEEGIYKIDKSFFDDLDIDISEIDPRTVKIYNNGGYILPWDPDAERTTGLLENAIYAVGEEDGVFNTNDYFLFYGRGVDFWEYDITSSKITRNKNWYSTQNYYWLTFDGDFGKRMEVQENVSGTPDNIQTTTLAYNFLDEDKQNLLSSGLVNVGDEFSSTQKTRNYLTSLPERIDGTEINYKISFVNGYSQNKIEIYETDNQIINKYISGYKNDSYSDYSVGKSSLLYAAFNGDLEDERSNLKFVFTPSTLSDRAYLDFIEIEYTMSLTQNDDEIIYFGDNPNGITKFEITGFSSSDIFTFNISEFSEVKLIEATINGGTAYFNSDQSNIGLKYISVHSNQFKLPSNSIKQENSELISNNEGAKYLIITDKIFNESAEKLLQYRSSDARFPISSKIIYMQEIFDNFSCGSLDPTAIRDFLKYTYELWKVKPEYILLFGDGDFDYLDLLGLNKNFIPTFQETTTSFNEVYSYPLDDFYSRIIGSDEMADLAIGRLNVTTDGEASALVQKIIDYENNLENGPWRNKITLLADDGVTPDRNEGSLHTGQSENLSKKYIPGNFEENKIYLSEYKSINTGSGIRKPDCNLAILEAINNGTLIFNYVGHGNPDVWAHERVFERSVSIPQLDNSEYFFLTAATCDFGKYDDPELQSASEEMILMKNSGMIGGLTAARPVTSLANAGLNQTFYSKMLGVKDSLGYPIPIGKAYMLMKQIEKSTNDEKFHLLCDPYLRLNIPKVPIKISEVNDSNLETSIKIKALGNVQINGKVLNADSSGSAFNGEGIVSVFDSKKNVYLDDINSNMTEQGGVIYRGRVSVENGEFSTNFTVPKDISYENKNGKIIAYFFNDEIDGVGFTDSIIVGGTDTTNTDDKTGPDIEILYDDQTESSYLVGPNFDLKVKLFDDTGLNTTGAGIGHTLEAVLNDDVENSIDLTNFFIGDLDSEGKSGEINYQFSSLDPGEYKIKINAWDVFNNYGSREDYFTVVADDDLVVREVYNYPNPFKTNTYFTFQHNLSGLIDVKIKVYTVAGRNIKTLERYGISDRFVKIEWDGKDDDNNKIANGTYLYKLIVNSTDGEFTDNILGKMAVIR